MSKSVLETEEGKDAVRFHTAIMESFKDFELSQVSEWVLVLLQSKLEAIDKILQRGLTQLNWKSHSINEFISNAMTVVKESSGVPQTIKKNVTDSEKQFQVWCEVPFMDRKSAKTYTIEEFQATMPALVVAKYEDMEEKDEKLHELLSSNCRVLKVNLNPKPKPPPPPKHGGLAA